MEQHQLDGSFEVTGKLMVTDPCYKRGTWCQAVLENVKSGTWKACIFKQELSGWGNRVAVLRAYHHEHSEDRPAELINVDIGVDSGQAGIFNEERYPNGETGEYKNLNTFYGRACEATSPEDGMHGARGAGILTEGVASCSGCGDGGYECFVARNDEKQIVSAEIVFLSDEDFDEGEDGGDVAWDDNESEDEDD